MSATTTILSRPDWPLPAGLPHKELRRFLTRRDGVAGAYLAGVWAGIGGLILLAAAVPHAAVWAGGFVLMGALQHHLAVLHHEAVHHLLFRSRRWNEGFGFWLTGYPIGLGSGHRHVHLHHHRRLGRWDDPELLHYEICPVGIGGLVMRILWTMSGLAVLAQTIQNAVISEADCPGKPRPPRSWPRILAAQGMIALACLAAGNAWLYFWLWFLPRITWSETLMSLRRLAAHLDPGTGGGARPRWRTIICHPLEALFLAPAHHNYHAEHHRYPQVPFYHLPALHRRLMIEPPYARQVEVRYGYLRFLGQCVRAAGRSGSAPPRPPVTDAGFQTGPEPGRPLPSRWSVPLPPPWRI